MPEHTVFCQRLQQVEKKTKMLYPFQLSFWQHPKVTKEGEKAIYVLKNP